ncbi:acyl-CoA dehydrogenase family protein [Umezawaea beigongshangensis]|uniref:acyl-CoA dehydrogenase family protein n=1 Tax=Umezawaea beigongshangensis TaxID=2780383 RepID=UPI0018F18F19|nr:acyl-CoA dehydrogenase family protein [Umezawaea beigongshangensis]
MTFTAADQKWLAVADEVAATLRTDAAERDRANLPPVREVELLRESGLLTVGLDGDGWATRIAVTRTVAAADASIGHLLGYHHLQLWRSELFDNAELTARTRAETARDRLFWAGVSNPLDAALQLTPVDGGFVVEGTKTFATGASLADRLVVSATRVDTGEKVTFVVRGGVDGLDFPGGWDNIGQRLTASGGVRFQRVFVPAEDVLGVQPEENHPRLSLAALGFQLVLSHVHVAIAEGALAEAAEYTRTRSRPWFASGVDHATDDPHVLASYGEMVADVRAAALLADRAAEELAFVADRGTALTAEQRAAAATSISQAKVVSTRVVNQVTTRVFEQVGARATASGHGFDRFWRNARTLTLHDPVAYKAREVGAYFLTGAHPAFTGYS